MNMEKSPSESSLRSLTMGELHDRIELDITWLLSIWTFFCDLFSMNLCKGDK